MMVKKKYRLLTILGAGLVGAFCAAPYTMVFITYATSPSAGVSRSPAFLAPLPLSICAALACGIMSMVFWMAFVVIAERITVRRGMFAGMISTVCTIPLAMILMEIYQSNILHIDPHPSFGWDLEYGFELGIIGIYVVTVTTYGSAFLIGSFVGWHYAWFVRKFCSQEARPRESLYSSPSKRAENRQD